MRNLDGLQSRSIRNGLNKNGGSPKVIPPIITNGDFTSDVTGWTSGNSAVLESVAGGSNGNCLMMTNGNAQAGQSMQKVTLPQGNYTLFVKHKNGTATGYVSIESQPSWADIGGGEVNNAAWTEYNYTFNANGDVYIDLWCWSTTQGLTTYFDEVRLVKNP
jgi:hypothetical protein